MPSVRPAPPDQQQRELALAPGHSILVQAPAGSGKTTLLAERFLSLLALVDDPAQVVAITFTNAAAAEMRNRILDELRSEHPGPIARAALAHSQARGWNLLDLPSQLRITTIDAFCRSLALQQPLLSGLGAGLDIAGEPRELYRRAARQTLSHIGDAGNPVLSAAIEELLLWRDNNWKELEDLVVKMLATRDRWMHDFVFDREPNWDELRARLESPFVNAVRDSLESLNMLLDQVPDVRHRAHALARFGCQQENGEALRDLAEIADFPCAPFLDEDLEAACRAHLSLTKLALTEDGNWRRKVDTRDGFPADCKAEKAQVVALINDLATIPGLDAALKNVDRLPAPRYPDEEWAIVRACFILLRHAAGELKTVFAESATVDFIEIAQIAQSVLRNANGFPAEAAGALADKITHLLVDEFQDTSRRQHDLLRSLIGAWPDDRAGRTCFVVGDPMQSIYSFRGADAELFPRVRDLGLEIGPGDALQLDSVPLSANFRATPTLVDRLNDIFATIFSVDDGSKVTFSKAEPVRERSSDVGSTAGPHCTLHLEFIPDTPRVRSGDPDANRRKEEAKADRLAAHQAQIDEIVELAGAYHAQIEDARAKGGKFRIAVLARAHKSLTPVAEALRKAGIPFVAVELEKLAERPEILDAIALARALLNPHDRVAWLGVLRAPWCGLSLADLHSIAGDPGRFTTPIPTLLAENLHKLGRDGRAGATRVLAAFERAPALRASMPSAAPGTFVEQIWLALGGADCVDRAARANVDLLWKCIDRLPAGEQDLPGPVFEAALDKLCALPDPAASTDLGVQLMTIHKSKGLEFEVVLILDLQDLRPPGERNLLSWLERGVPPDSTNDAEDISEFLVAPLQSKGTRRGRNQSWVDRVKWIREAQETRRLLYVAATRAREELHIFARPTYKRRNGEIELVEPRESLLKTAWPAFEQEIRRRFAERVNEFQPSEPEQAVLFTLAASGDDNLLVMPPPIKPTILRRLPADYAAAPGPQSAPPGAPASVRLAEDEPSSLYARHEGGLLSRALGTAVHAFLQELARLRAQFDWAQARTALRLHQPPVAASVRALGIDAVESESIAAQALKLAFDASNEPAGAWILSPHPDAESEVRWSGVVESAITTIRIDRVFRAGLVPQSEGNQAWWIVDFKTAQAGGADSSAALARLRPLFAPQLEAYARVLRNLHGADAVIRAALYYPRMVSLDWWEI
jgi:ATP-dependent exoDNAse (exonuclease V) beta subunit